MADQEIPEPSPEQIAAYAQRVEATLALARFQRLCASLPKGTVTHHPTEQNCIRLPTLVRDLTLVRTSEQIVMAARSHHCDWLQGFPLAYIAVGKNELFFVSQPYDWLKTQIEAPVIATGILPYTDMLADMAQQDHVLICRINQPGAFTSVEPMRDGIPVALFKTQDGVPVLNTYAALQRAERAPGSNAIDQMFN